MVNADVVRARPLTERHAEQPISILRTGLVIPLPVLGGDPAETLGISNLDRLIGPRRGAGKSPAVVHESRLRLLDAGR